MSNQWFLMMETPSEDAWLFKLYKDVYAVIGLQSYTLAASGIRTIVDYIVTWKAGDFGDFKSKLKRLAEAQQTGSAQVDVIYSTFDAGSAAAHRGYDPQLQDVYTMLDIAELLIERFYIEPGRHRRHEKAAANLRKNTPARLPRPAN